MPGNALGAPGWVFGGLEESAELVRIDVGEVLYGAATDRSQFCLARYFVCRNCRDCRCRGLSGNALFKDVFLLFRRFCDADSCDSCDASAD